MSLFGAVFLLHLLQVRLVLRGCDTPARSAREGHTALPTGDTPETLLGTESLAGASGYSSEPVSLRTAGTLPVIVVFALAFRLLLLFSDPIQEVDAYRYLWDGQVVAAGVNPFRYSPQQVLDADVNADLPDDLRRLVDLRDRSPAHQEILRRVHFGELTTVYPPVSQAVFALAAVVTPASATVHTHLLVMKSLIVAFDLATFGMLLLLLRLVNRPPEWSIIYAWCPLLMKEFANSGHLDSIAVFVTTAAIYCAVRGLFPHAADQRMGTTKWLLAGSLLLGLGVGAKIYPAIFAPLLIVSAWHRVGFRTAAAGAIVCAAVSAVMILPMLTRDQSRIDARVRDTLAVPSTEAEQAAEAAQAFGTSENVRSVPPHPDTGPKNRNSARVPLPGDSVAEAAQAFGSPGKRAFEPSGRNSARVPLRDDPLPDEPRLPEAANVMVDDSLPEPGAPPVPPVPEGGVSGPEIDPASTGLSAFAAQWQMNDFLFLLLFENLTPDRGPDSSRTAWFVVTLPDWRDGFVGSVSQATGLAPNRVPFLITRVITTAIFGALALWWAWQAAVSTNATNWLMFAFLTVAWFWLLQPTQNPWYWAWALPLVPFARSRAWLLLSGLALCYYLRFWCLYNAPQTPLFGTRYAGVDFFDFVGSWIEFAPWFVLLAVEWKFARPDESVTAR